MQACVDHTAEVLGCEVSWTGLVDGDRLVMGAHRGLVTSEMASTWHLGVGEGIGGKAVAERRPIASRDYRHDSRRVPLLKRLIDDEGILATLAVPLLVAESAIGVLYAARRRVHSWTEREKAIALEAAHDLAVRLHQLRGHEQALGARDDLLRVAGEVAALVKNLDVSAPTAVVDYLAHRLDVRVELHGPHDQLIHAAGQERPDGTTAWRDRLSDSPATTLTVVSAGELGESGHALVELCAALARLQALRVTERERVVERITGDLVDRLLSGRFTDPAALARQAAMAGIDLAPPSHVIVVRRRDRSALDPAQATAVARALQAAFRSCTTILRDDRLAGIVGEPTSADLTKALAEALRGTKPPLVAGVGRQCLEIVDYSMSYDEARAAVEIAINDGSPASVVSAYELGILGVASLPVDHLRTTVRDLLGPLADSDNDRGTEYVATLRAYLQHDRHLARTAEALHVHYNTVRYRIAKIEQLLRADLRDVDVRFRLETALRMHRLIEAVDTDGP